MAGPKDWSPKVNYEVERILIREIEGSIRAMKDLTKYAGPDHEFGNFVALNTWDVEDYRYIGWNTGMLIAYLDLAGKLKIKLPEELVTRGNYYIYE